MMTITQQYYLRKNKDFNIVKNLNSLVFELSGYRGKIIDNDLCINYEYYYYV